MIDKEFQKLSQLTREYVKEAQALGPAFTKEITDSEVYLQFRRDLQFFDDNQLFNHSK